MCIIQWILQIECNKYEYLFHKPLHPRKSTINWKVNFGELHFGELHSPNYLTRLFWRWNGGKNDVCWFGSLMEALAGYKFIPKWIVGIFSYPAWKILNLTFTHELISVHESLWRSTVFGEHSIELFINYFKFSHIFGHYPKHFLWIFKSENFLSASGQP